ncbi:YlzJ-like family protein [Metabacillus herbersteinensis]|uniref:YlzJ-like family protein n=1 Tax=Metabacillus herbersteinensis TaxID=283816 RepID=A0ABV6GCH1_9BACI
MILYTMMPNELIYPTADNIFEKQSIVSHNGVELLVQQTENSQYEIIRVLSSDPNHYLNQQYCPGQKLSGDLCQFYQ